MIVFRRKEYDLAFILLPLVFLIITSCTFTLDCYSAVLFILTTLMTLCGVAFRRHRKISRILFLLYFPFYLFYSISLALLAPICRISLGVFIPLLGCFFHYFLLSNMYDRFLRKKIGCKYISYIKLIPVVLVYSIYLSIMFILSAQLLSEILAIIVLGISLFAFIVFICSKRDSKLCRLCCYWTFFNFCISVLLSYFIIVWPNPNIGFVLCSYMMSYAILSTRIVKEIANERHLLVVKTIYKYHI